MTCNAEQMIKDYINGNISDVKQDLKSCSKKQVLEFVEEYSEQIEGASFKGLHEAIQATKRLLE